MVRVEKEGGSSGKRDVAHLREKLAGFDFDGVSPNGPKIERARPVSSAAQAGNVKLVEGRWNEAWLDEAETFPQEGQGFHDDQVDAVSGAVEALAFGQRRRLRHRA